MKNKSNRGIHRAYKGGDTLTDYPIQVPNFIVGDTEAQEKVNPLRKS